MTNALPVDQHWYRSERLSPTLWLITEPHVHPIWSANMHLVIARDRDLLIDSGMSIADYSQTLRRLRKLPVTQVHGGHDPSFGRERLHDMIDHYLALWGTSDGG